MPSATKVPRVSRALSKRNRTSLSVAPKKSARTNDRNSAVHNRHSAITKKKCKQMEESSVDSEFVSSDENISTDEENESPLLVDRDRDDAASLDPKQKKMMIQLMQMVILIVQNQVQIRMLLLPRTKGKSPTNSRINLLSLPSFQRS